MNRKQALRWLHRNAGRSENGMWHVARFGNSCQSMDWNEFRGLFLSLVTAENMERQAKA